MEQLQIPTITLNTGQKLPLIGLGTWPLNDAEAAEVVPTALAQGYRLIDTAARYGNEAGVGRGIAAAGVSNFKQHHLQRLIDETGVTPTVDQIQLSPALPRPEIRAYLAAEGIAAQAWSPLGLPEGVQDAPIVAELAAKYGRPPTQIILRWHVQQGISAIPKSADPRRQRENAEVFDFALEAGEVAALATLDVGEAVARNADTHEIF
jgi:diketogulonate reductase-like aldo/keto reductase